MVGGVYVESYLLFLFYFLFVERDVYVESYRLCVYGSRFVLCWRSVIGKCNVEYGST